MGDPEIIAMFIFTWISQAAILAKILRCPHEGCCRMEGLNHGTSK